MFLIIIALLSFYPESKPATNDKPNENILTIKGNLFYLDNEPFDMWGIRVASASQTEELTNHLIAQLDDYKRYGVNTIDVFFQGSSGKFTDPFLENGKQLQPGHLNRMKRIIAACNKRDMVVVVGIFYQRTMANMDATRNISDSAGVEDAVKTTARELKAYRNVVLNIANEQNSSIYKGCRFYNFNNPGNIITLCKIAKAIAPEMLVGGGGYLDESNIVIGKSSSVDILLFDTNGKNTKEHYELFKSRGIAGKPIVNVEMFGGWTARFMPPGFYPEDGKKRHFEDVDEASANAGLYVHFHSSPWCQGPAVGKGMRFDLGGMGTMDDPGIRWWFDYVQRKG